jgi:hypothetical protein
VKKHLLLTTLFSLLIFNWTNALALTSLEDLESEEGSVDQSLDLPDLPTEVIKKAGVSRRIFIMTNNNANLNKGDFITIVKNKTLASRALVAKTTTNGLAGIKLLKIYSLNTWNNLRLGNEVQIIKGDDSFARNKVASSDGSDDGGDTGKIQDEEDLFNETAVLDDDLTLDENKKRLLKTDHIISANIGLFEGVDDAGASKRYTLTGAAWAYQIEDNIWAEASLLQGKASDFPSSGLQTSLLVTSIRAKYVFEGPSYSYFLPYFGYMIVKASSPDAGVDATGDTDQTVLDREVQLVEDMAENKIVFGVTVLKRLVPGWFVRADLGLDQIGFGASLEF